MNLSLRALRVPRRSILAASLAIACGVACSTEEAFAHMSVASTWHGASDLDSVLPAYIRLEAAKAYADNPHQIDTAMDHVVTSCLDDGSPGTLRAIIENANTHSGDSINLTSLVCANSKITLGTTMGISGPIHVAQYDLDIHGPQSAQLTIDADFHAKIFDHSGIGTLGISHLTLANGSYVGPNNPQGGCISSKGNVLLIGSTVTNCTVGNTVQQTAAVGGGIYARGDLALFESIVSGNTAKAHSGTRAFGGGAFAGGSFTALYSSVSGNKAIPATGDGVAGYGGGIYVNGDVDVEGSTISGNHAYSVGGLFGQGASTTNSKLINSTVSGNTASYLGGIALIAGQVVIANSTLAFNTATNPQSSTAGAFVQGSTLNLDSTIVADNAGPNGPSDLDGSIGAMITGASNLITSSTINVPFGTLFDCPKLDPIANNGGTTLTHKLRHDSPAIDRGDSGMLLTDQRGASRVFPGNGQADIGAVEWQPTDVDERILASGFDGVCDR